MQISVRHWSHANNYTVRPNARHILCISGMQLITARRERERQKESERARESFRFINCCKIKSGMENIFLEIDFTDFAFRILLRVYYANNARGKLWLRMCVCVYSSYICQCTQLRRSGSADSADCTCRGYTHTHTNIFIFTYIRCAQVHIFKFIQNTGLHTVQFTVLRKIISKHCGYAAEHDQKSNIFKIFN